MTKPTNEDITSLSNALGNVFHDEDEHVGADIPISVLEFVSLVPVDAADGMEQKNHIFISVFFATFFNKMCFGSFHKKGSKL